ncbi:GNAT family N-acetyltransferase [Nonomuraea lactucae]|uniref:GNAT family N-acetyltransferase n=1 Tax=Nonomuraea lactucae TaxID=2249762 RepID=UPI001F06ED09|nr:GNAT family N-acetyltransferase [Nonomuraea lactucae]
MSPTEIELLPVPAGTDATLVAELTDLVNRVYAAAEEGLWQDGAARTTEEGMSELIRAGEIAVARVNGRIVGSVRVQRLKTGEGEFGQLATEPEHRGAGIGRRLVEFAEQWSRDRGLTTMQLELLVPRGWKHPSKEFLNDWYTRIGYQIVRIGAIEESYPDLAPLLATSCDFRIYHKDLSPPPDQPSGFVAAT